VFRNRWTYGSCIRKFQKEAYEGANSEAWSEFKGIPQELQLPSVRSSSLSTLKRINRPQAKLDRDYENGMGVCMGRLREDTVFDYKFVGLSHNTVRGAAGGGVLTAELLKAQGYITAK
jgi:aspartate-semialdehyde dehydrogenase